jgi:K+-transporting ATPase ATPase A chain
MPARALLLLLVYLAILVALTPPLGAFIRKVVEGERTFLHPLLGPIERGLYRAARIDPRREMRWTEYATAMLLFSFVGMLVLYALQRVQGVLPLNPAGLGAVAPWLAFNTSASFVSNTNWQFYSGESTLSYLTQMVGLTWHNFTSAATGLVLAIALVRAIARKNVDTVGNFWADLTRVTLYVLLPLSVVGALFLVSQGVIQNLHPYTAVTTLDGAQQVIAQGPVASQEIIKMLGTNGGGFFNANSAHPFENPTPLTNFFETLAILAIPSALTYTFGKMVGDTRQGWALWGAMAIVFVAGFLVCAHYEYAGTAMMQPNLEGKELRFGVGESALWATATTAASNGSVNAMHDSFTPLGGLVPMLNLQLGEIIFGGVGSGLYGMILFALLAVFIAGLMVGRTPEYLGKKIEGREMKLAMLAILILPLFILGFTAIASVTRVGVAALGNAGPHGFSEILYAFSSAVGNNGSAFAGLSGANRFWLIAIGVAMLAGRFFMIVPIMAIAGSLARKNRVPPGAGTLATASPLFVGLLVGVILIVGALTFFPALALGPIVEHLEMLAGRTF